MRGLLFRCVCEEPYWRVGDRCVIKHSEQCSNRCLGDAECRGYICYQRCTEESTCHSTMVCSNGEYILSLLPILNTY